MVRRRDAHPASEGKRVFTTDRLPPQRATRMRQLVCLYAVPTSAWALRRPAARFGPAVSTSTPPLAITPPPLAIAPPTSAPPLTTTPFTPWAPRTMVAAASRTWFGITFLRSSCFLAALTWKMNMHADAHECPGQIPSHVLLRCCGACEVLFSEHLASNRAFNMQPRAVRNMTLAVSGAAYIIRSMWRPRARVSI